jgi:hypothetical protein
MKRIDTEAAPLGLQEALTPFGLAQLAEAMGISYASLYNYDVGKSPMSTERRTVLKKLLVANARRLIAYAMEKL